MTLPLVSAAALALAALVGGGVQSPPAVPAAGEVACTRSSGLLYVELGWDERTLLALVDTGASASAIDPRVSGQLASGGRSEVMGTTGTLEAELVTVRGLSLGGLPLADLEATRRDLSGLLPLGDRRVEFILGSDAFAGRVVTIDFAASRLALAGPASPAEQAGESVSMTLDNGIPVIGGSIEGLELPLRIDTGASLFDTPDVYLNVPTRVWQSLLERRPDLAPSTHFAGTGASGETIELPVVPVRAARVGPLLLETAFIIVQPETGYFASPNAKAFVGNNALEKLGRVTLDYAAGRFFAAPAGKLVAQAAGDEPGVVAQMQAEAAAMQRLVSSPLAGEFLAATACLPRIEAPRTVFHDKAQGRALTVEQAASMTPEQLEGFAETGIDEAFYYRTRYGTPVAFVRPLEILGQAGVATADGLKLLDFGFGSIGQLRALASAGADATGIEVDPLLEALYSQPGDTGGVARCASAGEGRGGQLSLVFGRFPADAPVVEKLGGGYDAFVSKNTLKRGYIHPEKPVDPRRLVQLGVDDETFVHALFDLLKPGGCALIYNLCPAPSQDDEPYKPWSDGRSPFARELYEQVGFAVEAFDADDTSAARAMGAALGWGAEMDLESDLFGTYTLLRKPAGP